MVLITDGVDTGSKISRDKAIEAAQKADCDHLQHLLRGPCRLRPRLRNHHVGGGQGEGELRRMSTETGGRVFKVDRSNSLDDIFQDMQEEMRSQYSIGYQPPNPKKDGSYHKIEIRVGDKNYKVQARKGYYAVDSTGN